MHYFIKIVYGFHWLFLSMVVAVNLFALPVVEDADSY
jgi:hypothetical protein